MKDERGRRYTLKHLSTEDYIRHPWFEVHGCAIRNAPGNHGVTNWLPLDKIRYAFGLIDWANTAVLSHHAHFDMAILNWVFGMRPKAILDTLSMARLLLGNHLSVSLDAVRTHFGMPHKKTPYHLFKGKHWHELSPATQTMLADGCVDEVESIWRVFNLLAKDFPAEEYRLVDMTVRMFTEPVLRGDIPLLASIWEKEAAEKQARYDALDITESQVQSADQFAALLLAEGVEPATKDGKNGDIYAFAKNDAFMKDLVLHENDRVSMLAEARLAAKSTLLQTRSETLGWMARRGPMPVYIRYCGAHTTRDSGGDGANWQNFKRGSDLRRAIMAPEGFWLAAIDLSQIECRLLNYLAGQDDVIERFRHGEDPYIGIASKVYGFPVTKAHPKERGTGKQLELSCGYQAGAQTIQATARLGIYGPPVSIDLPTALQWRNLYRSTHPSVVDYWGEAGRMISRLAGGDPLQWGPMVIRNKCIYGPGGTMLVYDTLEHHEPTLFEEVREFEAKGYWRIKTRQGWTRLYSGKLVENVVQWLARIVMMQAAVRIHKLGYRIATRTHDELLVLIPKGPQAEHQLGICKAEMTRTPEWLPGLPLDCEGELSDRYAK